jgi:cytochrome c551/c552
MRRIVLFLVLATVLAGCGGGEVVGPYPETVVGTVPKSAPVTGGSATAGKALFASNGCGACHTYKPANSNGKVGPDLDNVAADAKKANQGGVDAYVAASIKNPNAYVVPGFQQGVMPAFDSLNNKQLADLVAFLTQS